MLYRSFEKKACEIERLFYFALKNALTETGEHRKINRTDILFYFKAGEMVRVQEREKKSRHIPAVSSGNADTASGSGGAGFCKSDQRKEY